MRYVQFNSWVEGSLLIVSGQHLFTCSIPIFQRSGRDEPSEQHSGIKEVREDGNLLMIPGIHQ